MNGSMQRGGGGRRKSAIPECPTPKKIEMDAGRDNDTKRESDTRSKDAPAAETHNKNCSPSYGLSPMKAMRAQQAQLEEALEQIKSLQHENQRLLASKLASCKQLDAATRAKEGLQADLAAARKEHFDGIQEHIAKAAELEACQQRLNEMAATFKASSATSEIYTRGLASSVATRMAAAKEKEEMMHALTQKEEALQAVQDLVTELQGQLQMLQADKEHFSSQVEQLQETAANRAAAVAELQDALAASQDQLSALEKSSQEQAVSDSASQADYKATIKGLQTQAEVQATQHSAALVLLENQQEACIARLHEVHAARCAQLEADFKESLRQAQLDQQQHTDQLDTLKHQLQESQMLAQEQKQRLATTEQQLQDSNARLRELQAEVVVAAEQTTQLYTQQINTLTLQLQAETEAVAAQLQASNARVQELQGEAANATEQIQQLQAEAVTAAGQAQQLQASNTRVQQLQSEASTAAEQIQKLQAATETAAEQAQQLHKANARVQQLETEAASAAEQILKFTHAFSTLQTQQREREQKADAELGEADARAADLEVQLGAVQARVTEADAKLSGAEARASDLEAQLAAINALVTETVAKQEEADARTAELELQLGAANVRAVATQAQLSAANAHVSNLEVQLEALDAQVAETETELCEADARAAELTVQLGVVDARVGDTEASLEEADGHVDDMEELAVAAAQELASRHDAELQVQQEILEDRFRLHLSDALRAQEVKQAAFIQSRIDEETKARSRKLQDELEDLRAKWMDSQALIKELEAPKSGPVGCGICAWATKGSMWSKISDMSRRTTN